MNWSEKVTHTLEALLDFSEQHGLFEAVDRPYYRNLLLDVMGLDAPDGDVAPSAEVPATATQLLRTLCEPLGVKVIVVPMAQFEEKPVSSTRIRTALEGGDIPAANAMLGMPYAIRFAVQHGAGLGHTLGVPTINQLYPQGFQLPRFGIYITRTKIGDVWYPSATGLGTRPTVNNDPSKVTCETFIPGFSGDLYGTDPVVEFHAYLSPSKKFDTLDELRACINNAAKRAQEYFA